MSKPKSTTQPERMTVEEAADFLGVTVRTLNKKAQAGLIRKHHAPIGIGRGGRHVYYLRSELEKIKAQMLPSVESER